MPHRFLIPFVVAGTRIKQHLVAAHIQSGRLKAMAIQDYLAKQGMNLFSSTPEQLATMMKVELAKWAKVIKTANIKLEN